MADLLNVLKCNSCDRINCNPFDSCRFCGEQALKKLEMPKNGTLYTFTKIHFPPEEWSLQVPYVVGVVSVSVDDGLVLLTALYNGDAPLEIGADVRIDVSEEKVYFQLAL